MKKLFLLFLSAFFLLHSAFAQNPLVKQWDYRFGGDTTDYLSSVQITRDGGFILGGNSFSGIGGDKTQNTIGGWDYWIVKLDADGHKEWDKDFGGTGDEELTSLEQTTDGGYILGGYSWSGISGDKTQNTKGATDYWIVKIDSLGNKLWDKDFGGMSGDALFSLKQTTDGGYILGGYSLSGIGGDKTQDTIGGPDYWIVKTDSLGNKEWDKDFGGTSNDFFSSLQQTTDGGFLLGGYSFSGIGGDKSQASYGTFDYWIVKIDSLGVKQWDRDFGGTWDDWLFSLQQTTDGGFILGGWSYSNISGNKTTPLWGAGNSDFWIIKTDSLGNKQWEKDFGGTSSEEDFGNISLTTDGGYLFAGSSYSSISGDKTENNLGLEQTWIIKTDSLGNKQWDKTLLTSGHVETGFAVQTNDGCYAFANEDNGGIGGDRTQASQGFYDYWIIKFCDSILCYAAIPTITQTGDTLFANQNYAGYQWYFGSAPISGATNYFYVATQSGNFNIAVTDSSGCRAGAGIINVVAGFTPALPKGEGVSVYPNPARDEFTVYGLPFTVGESETALYNAMGEKVYSVTLSNVAANRKLQTVNCKQFPAGIYLLKISSEEKIFTKKIVIDR